jgi:hypothetical protein
MTTIQRAVQIVANAEAALKRLIAEAAERGEYSSVETLAQWASSLGALCSKEQMTQLSKAAAPSPSKGHAPSLVTSKRKPPSKSSGRARRAYPVFAKSGDVLTKIGWSKSSKMEYQHKSPRIVTKMLAASLATQAKSGTIVSMDKILPLKAEDGSEVPDYQAYVSLAWLRQIGVVKQNGRQGYTVSDPDDLPQNVDAAWANLPDVASR